MRRARRRPLEPRQPFAGGGIPRPRVRERPRLGTARAVPQSERKRFEALLDLRGVSVSMASALLVLLNPKRYGVIDIRV